MIDGGGLALVHVENRLYVERRQLLSVADEPLLLGWVSVIARTRIVVHDAAKIVVGPTHLWIVLAIPRGAGVGRVVRSVLGRPPAGDLVPVHPQEGPVPVVPPCRIGPLLLVVQAKGVPNLVDDTARIAHVVAPTQVDPRASVPHPGEPARAVIVLAGGDAVVVVARGPRQLVHVEEVD